MKSFIVIGSADNIELFKNVLVEKQNYTDNIETGSTELLINPNKKEILNFYGVLSGEEINIDNMNEFGKAMVMSSPDEGFEITITYSKQNGVKTQMKVNGSILAPEIIGVLDMVKYSFIKVDQ